MCIWVYVPLFMKFDSSTEYFPIGYVFDSLLYDWFDGIKKRFSINSVVNYLEITYCNKM